jgi:hypothetical protein
MHLAATVVANHMCDLGAAVAGVPRASTHIWLDSGIRGPRI